VNEQVVACLRVVLALDVPAAYGGAWVGRVVGQRAEKAVLWLTVGAEDTSSRRLALNPHDVVALCASGLGGRGRVCWGGRAADAAALVGRVSRGDAAHWRAGVLGYCGHYLKCVLWRGGWSGRDVACAKHDLFARTRLKVLAFFNQIVSLKGGGKQYLLIVC
jgi:hypothetical protein